MILVRVVISKWISGFVLLVKNGAINGIIIIAMAQTTVVKNVTTVKVEFRNCLVSDKEEFTDFSSSNFFLKVGIKATEIAFSAKSLLKRFGN